jgi:hypothetical protein
MDRAVPKTDEFLGRTPTLNRRCDSKVTQNQTFQGVEWFNLLRSRYAQLAEDTDRSEQVNDSLP